jgi:MoxR-like ATPase
MTITAGDHEARDARPETFGEVFDRIAASVAGAIHGKDDVIRAAITCLLAEGHLLVEDVPGVGKTSLAKALARALRLDFGRIQFTPDLLPSDVVGSSVWNAHDGSIEFHPGPVFTNLLLGDEINRASPKTQSALLEAMEERQVTVEGTTRRTPDPFMVIATQNPIEHHGTFPLPESQLDRFLMRLSVGYPDHRHEVALLTEADHQHVLERVAPVTDPAGVAALIRVAGSVHVADALAGYVVDLASRSRHHADVALGISPRASLGLLRAARVRAAASGRNYVIPDDVKHLAVPVLAHRLVLSPAAASRGAEAGGFVQHLLETTPVPA